jgi:glucose-1-phosphate thymidylyltransferase
LNEPQFIGVIPAAGRANRLGQMPFSKELFPIGTEPINKTPYPKVALSYLLDYMTLAGITDFHLIINKDKWDIPSYFRGGRYPNTNICYHIVDNQYGVPFTINQAFPFIKNRFVALGFPDILFRPENAYSIIINELLKQGEINIILGLFPTNRPDKCDMVVFDNDLNITNIIIKPTGKTTMKYSWLVAAWKPDFSAFLHDFVTHELAALDENNLNRLEYHMGHVFISAIKKGIKIKGILYDKGAFIDIGTPGDLIKAHHFYKS